MAAWKRFPRRSLYVDHSLGNSYYTFADEKQPRSEELEALDVPCLNEQLLALFAGEEVEIPVFDFKSGRRRETGRLLRLGRRTMLIVEGIHGLNDALNSHGSS